jgi:YidC/Oxa1 family membrane protein insertase
MFDSIAKPIAEVLAFFYSLVPNYAVAIVLLTTVMMIVLTPLTIKQTRSMLVMQKLQPELKKLQEKHKNDRQALNEAVMALYKEHNANPLGGCLPMLLPFPVFIALFEVLRGLARTVPNPKGAALAKVSDPKYVPHTSRMYHDIVAAHGQIKSFGIDLAKAAGSHHTSFGNALPYYIVLLLMIGTQFYQQRQLTSRTPQTNNQQAQMMKYIPIFFGVISIRFPAGVVLYWTVSNGIRIFQQWAMYQYDPKVKALVAKDVQEVEAKTREIDAKQDAKQPSGRPRLRDLLSGTAGTDVTKNVRGGNGTTNPKDAKNGRTGATGAGRASARGAPNGRGGNGGPAGKPGGSGGPSGRRSNKKRRRGR